MRLTEGQIRQVARRVLARLAEGADVEEKWAARMELPALRPWIDAILTAPDPRALSRARKAAEASPVWGLGPESLSDGMIDWLVKRRREELRALDAAPTRSSAEQRADAILRTRDSSGRARARRR